MTRQQLIGRARAELDAGKGKAALGSAWQAVNEAMIAQDQDTVRDAEILARDLAAASDGRLRRDAEQLAAYCSALLAGVGGGVTAPGVWGRILGGLRRPEVEEQRRPCPECAEQVKVEAKVCYFCGHRFGGPDG